MKVRNRLTDVSFLTKVVRVTVVGTLAVLLTAHVTGTGLVSKAQAGTSISCAQGCDLSLTIAVAGCDAAQAAALAAINACDTAFTACETEKFTDCLIANIHSLAGIAGCIANQGKFTGCPVCGSAGAVNNQHTFCVKTANENHSLCLNICAFLADLLREGFLTGVTV